MKKFISVTFLFSLILTISVSAQLREDINKREFNSSTFVNTKAPTVESSLSNFFQNNFSMSHSYSMSFGSVGGSFQNINAYTNTMQFAFSPRLTGRLDVSFMHSPFGQAGMMGSNNSLSSQVLIRNAEINYKLSDNAFLNFQYQQLPSTFGLYNPYGYNRFNSFGMWY